MFRSKCALKVLCVCVAILCVLCAYHPFPIQANAEDHYYTELRTYTIDSSMTPEQKLKILECAFPHGWYWNCYTEEELNGKQQRKIIINNDVYYISQLKCPGTLSQHNNTSLCRGYDINFYHGKYSINGTGGRQCTGFARMIFTYLWGAPTVTIKYRDDPDLLNYVEFGDFIFDGTHSYIILNNPNKENGKVVYVDCNGDNTRCVISWRKHTATSRNTLDQIKNKMKDYSSSGSCVVLHHAKTSQINVDPTELTITTQPQNVIVDKVNDQATTSVVATGDGLTYQWYRKEPGKEWGKSSKTTATYSLKLEEKYDGILIYCVITDQYGNTATTDTVSLTVRKTDYNPTTEYKVVYANGLRIRNAPGTSAGTVDVMKKDSHFWVDETSTQTGDGYTWAYSKLADGTTGWVAISNPDYCVPVGTSSPDGRIPGDVTGDRKINLSDVVRLLKYVSGWDVEIVEENSDVTGDGKITLSDVVRLLKYVSNWDVTLQ